MVNEFYVLGFIYFMYKAKLIVRSKNRVAVTIEDVSGDNDGLVYIVPMSKDRAKNLRRWLNGMANSKGPFDFKIGAEEFWFHRDIWHPMRECLGKWYEENYVAD